jgi:hypothetical protein
MAQAQATHFATISARQIRRKTGLAAQFNVYPAPPGLHPNRADLEA